jgi:putative membrane-bound dehydrogenase-like protein
MILRAFLFVLLLAVSGPPSFADAPDTTAPATNAAPETNAVAVIVTNAPPAAVTNATPPAPPKPIAKSPFNDEATAALRSLQIRSGFRVQLVAAEPLISNPVALAFDANGRLYVAEQPGNGSPGRVSLLEDDDGDGVFDKSAVFADNLAAPTALICYGGGVFVASGPKILFLKDTKGAGTADVRQEVFGGFVTNRASAGPGGSVNNFVWGLDNRIHAACAGASGDIACLAIPGNRALWLNGHDFAFDPRTLGLSAEAGGANRGVSFDNAGRRFTCNATQPVRFAVCTPVEAARNPFFIWPQLTTDLAPANLTVFSQRLVVPALAGPSTRAATPDRLKPGLQATHPPARFTRASALLVYRGGAFPTNFINDVFIADPALGVVSRLHLRENGLLPLAERPKAETGSEFLASRAASFRPVQVASGPDGTLYIADLAREQLEQPGTRGRIWRILPVGAKSQKPPQLAAMKTPALVPLLASPGGWTRDTAARLIFERQDTNAIPLLGLELKRAKSPLARLHALRALDGLGVLNEQSLLLALRDRDEAVREHAAQLAANFIRAGSISGELRTGLAGAANNASLRMQFRLILTLASVSDRAVAGDLAAFTRNARENRWIQCAILGAASGRADALFLNLVRDARLRSSDSGWVFLQELAVLAGRQPNSNMDAALQAIIDARMAPLDRYTLARSLGEGLRASGRTFREASPQGTWQRFGQEAINIAVGGADAPNLRAEATRFLGVSGYTVVEVGDWLLTLLAPGESQVVQSAAIEALSRFESPVITEAFIQRWPRLSVVSQQEIIRQMLGRYDTALALVIAIQQGRIPGGALSVMQVNFLRAHRHTDIAARATRLFGATERAGLAQQFAGALKLKGSATRGAPIFNNRCANCHRPGDEASAPGPSLESAALRTREKLLEDILEPSREVRKEFQTHVVQRTNNELLFGLVSETSPDTLLIRAPDRPPMLLPKSQVAESIGQDWSLMPADAAAGLNAQNLADLIEFITSGGLAR